MLSKIKQIGLRMIIPVFLLSLSVLTSGQASASQAATRGVIGHAVSSASQAAAKAYWTPQRMQNARPADELVAHAKLTKKPGPKGPSGSGAPAAPVASQKSTVPYAQIIPNATPVPTSNYGNYPYSTIGKVFFTDPSIPPPNNQFVCSGTAVNSNNKNVVDTAGHCEVTGGSGGNWFADWIFCPQYYKGNSPYGCWTASYFWSSTDWVNNGSHEEDFGDAVVSNNSYGALVDVVGGTGWAYNFDASQYFVALGYPAASPFDGETMYYAEGQGTSHEFDDGSVVSMSNDMTGGCSGGGWLITLDNTFGYVNGHNDFSYDNDPAHMYSPYYDSDWHDVFDAAQNT